MHQMHNVLFASSLVALRNVGAFSLQKGESTSYMSEEALIFELGKKCGKTNKRALARKNTTHTDKEKLLSMLASAVRNSQSTRLNRLICYVRFTSASRKFVLIREKRNLEVSTHVSKGGRVKIKSHRFSFIFQQSVRLSLCCVDIGSVVRFCGGTLHQINS
jgi:hypothetical protein